MTTSARRFGNWSASICQACIHPCTKHILAELKRCTVSASDFIKRLFRTLIEMAETTGGPNGSRLAALVRIHRVTELRKSHLLAIARHWRYRSYLW